MVEAAVKAEEVLNSFAEVMSGLLIDQYQKQIAELELTLPQAQVLRKLRRGPVTTGQLAEELRISAPAMTQLTDRLNRKGLIERRASDGDRRCVMLALSDEGTRLVNQFQERRRDAFRDALAQLSEAEKSQVVGMLERVLGALDDCEPESAVRLRGKNGSIYKKQGQ